MDELRKIMGLDGGYKVIKVEERKEDKVIAKFIYVETTSKKCRKRFKNNHLVDVLKYDLRENILDIDEELKMSYQLKELFLDITHRATYENVKSQLINWIALVREQNIEEMSEVANTIENWLEYICNSFIDKRFSNGFTDGLNNKIKVY